ncbi:MAG: hypothetical protein JWM09_649 [Francisellaceae bacterium]|nr:hypothetical protein [Francisellaceae bacterium]
MAGNTSPRYTPLFNNLKRMAFDSKLAKKRAWEKLLKELLEKPEERVSTLKSFFEKMGNEVSNKPSSQADFIKYTKDLLNEIPEMKQHLEDLDKLQDPTEKFELAKKLLKDQMVAQFVNNGFEPFINNLNNLSPADRKIVMDHLDDNEGVNFSDRFSNMVNDMVKKSNNIGDAAANQHTYSPEGRIGYMIGYIIFSFMELAFDTAFNRKIVPSVEKNQNGPKEFFDPVLRRPVPYNIV